VPTRLLLSTQGFAGHLDDKVAPYRDKAMVASIVPLPKETYRATIFFAREGRSNFAVIFTRVRDHCPFPGSANVTPHGEIDADDQISPACHMRSPER
jgi:hypothetical protein